MNKIIVSLFLLIGLSGCTKNPTDKAYESSYNTSLQNTPGLENCKLYNFAEREYSTPLKIVKCDDSVSTTNTVRQNKQNVDHTVITINGKQYIPKE